MERRELRRLVSGGVLLAGGAVGAAYTVVTVDVSTLFPALLLVSVAAAGVGQLAGRPTVYAGGMFGAALAAVGHVVWRSVVAEPPALTLGLLLLAGVCAAAGWRGRRQRRADRS